MCEKCETVPVLKDIYELYDDVSDEEMSALWTNLWNRGVTDADTAESDVRYPRVS